MINESEIKKDLLLLTSLPNLNKDYGEYLKGKKVILVGPAEYLLNNKMGSFIDSYDIVVRISNAYEYMPFDVKLSEDIGTKCNILYIHHELIKQHILGEKIRSKKHFLNFCRTTNIDFFSLANQENTFDQCGTALQGCHPSTKPAAKNFINLLKNNNINTKLNIVDEISKMSRKWCQGKYFGTGFHAIIDLLCYDIVELYVTGMTFYHGGGHMFHKLEGYDCKNLLPTKNYKNQTVTGQDTKNDLQVMKWLYEIFGDTKLKTDESIKKLMGII